MGDSMGPQGNPIHKMTRDDGGVRNRTIKVYRPTGWENSTTYKNPGIPKIRSGGEGSGCHGPNCGRPQLPQKDYVTLYHGTSRKAGEQIKKQGLKSGKKSPHDVPTEKVWGKGRIYVTTKPDGAHYYGLQTVEKTGKHYSVVEIRVPKAEYKKMFKQDPEVDDFDTKPDATSKFTKNEIPKEWIASVKMYDRNGSSVK